MQNSPNTPRVRMFGISKKFGNVSVLNDVQLDIFPGEVHLLAGENGAGKSTLIKILAGIHTDYEGTIELDGNHIRFTGPLHAEKHGIAVIHQELSLVPGLSITENLFLGRFPQHRLGFVDWKTIKRKSKQLMEQFELDVDVDKFVENYPISTQQLIEIAKALSQNAKVIVMDEPTSALNAPEVERLFSLIDRLKNQGCAIVYITHKMEEIERISDRITVLRDGTFVGTEIAANLSVPKLIQWMVGREVDEPYKRITETNIDSNEPVLQLENVHIYDSGNEICRDISFSVKPGEILGIAGLQGSGASPLLESLFGVNGPKAVKGSVKYDGQQHCVISPRDSLQRKISLLTNDRKAKGLVLPMSITENMGMSAWNTNTQDEKRTWFSLLNFMDFAKQKKAASELGTSMNLHAAALEMEVGHLSGGNQQKVALGKWIMIGPKLLLLDEPTRGVDIAAKQDIYRLIDQWTQKGVAVVLITSEMPELLALSDRIIVMHRGNITAHFTRTEADSHKILAAAMGRN